MRSIWFVVVFAAIAACGGGKKKAAQPAAESPPAISNTVLEEPPPPAEPPPAQTVAPASTGSPECDEYLAVFDQIIVDCEKELGPAFDAMKQSADAQREAFATWETLTPEERAATVEAAAVGCKAATDAIKQSAASLNCTLSL